MKIEKLRNNHKKEIIIGTVLVVVIGGALTYKLTHSKYRTTQSINLATGTINYTVPDFKIMAMYKNDGSGDVSIDSMPTSGYVINEEKTYCQTSSGNEVKGKIKTENGIHGISGLNKGDKCYLYFDKKTSVDNVNDLIAKVQSEAKTTKPNFSSIATSDEGVYATSDGMYDNGTTYYWRGAATNNYVKFAGFCWRIVRINGDGSLRLIYDGTTCYSNGYASSDRLINNSTNYTYSQEQDSPSYVGWTYILGLQRPTPETLNEAVNNNAKIASESWYANNIGKFEYYDNKVTKGKFCNDRRTKTGDNFTTSTNTCFEYKASERLAYNNTPEMSCEDSDIYELKVGAITADEVSFAGGVNGTANQSYYLYSGQYLTMTPYYWNCTNGSVFATIFTVGRAGNISISALSNTNGIKTVINLRSDVTFSSGDGTQNSPYVVS